VLPPPQSYRYFPPQEEIIVTSKKSTQRIIFKGGLKFSVKEKEAINQFKQISQETGYSIDPFFDDAEILRLLQVSKFDIKNAHKFMDTYLGWRDEHVPPRLTSLCEKLIHSGFLYIHGRDRRFRPLIVLNPTALLAFKSISQDVLGEEIIKSSIFIIEYVLKNMFLPGQIENYIVIIDVNKLGVSEIPKSILSKIIDCLSKGYRYRTKRMYVLNTTFSIKLAWKFIESFMAVHMKNKMLMTDKNTSPELLKGFHPSQLEEKFGGESPNRTEFWPPYIPSEEFGEHEE